MLRPSCALAAFLLACSSACSQEPPAAPAGGADEATRTPSDFVRFVAVGDGGHLDTAITRYRKGDVELTLYGAVHIADAACYAALNDRFPQHDALLYELVAPADTRPTKERETGFNPIGMLQQGLKNSMELTFQLEEVDYSPANFVHADMTPEEFERSMAERGESLLSIMLDMMLQGMQQQQQQGDGKPAAAFDLVKAFRSGEGRHTLRMAFASQLEQMEALAAGGKDSTLLQGRNEKCLEVLGREMRAGKRKIGIYYGAAHLPHMEQRLVEDLGFTKQGHEWLVAWDCTKRPDAKYDRALVQLRQRAKAELQALAAAARDLRRDAAAAPADGVPPTVQALAALQRDGKPRYTGPQQDPWGRDYVLEKRPSGPRWQVRSLGQDGQRGTADDLVVVEPRGGGLLGR